MSIRRILEALIGHDYRVTWQRWAVAAHIALKRDRLFTVEELYNSLKQHYPEIGLTTVYRTLDLLVELGVINRIHDEGGTARYALCNPDVQSIQEMVCDACGKVIPFDRDSLLPLLKGIAQREGFNVTHYEIKLFGMCPECVARADEPDSVSAPPAEGEG